MPTRRLLWLAVVLVSMALYLPINRIATGGTELSLSIDDHIPLWPPAVVPYVLGVVLFIGLPVWAAIRARPGEFEAYAVTLILMAVFSCIIFLAYPTYVTRPGIESGDVFARAIEFLYENDEVNNAAPSGHTFYALLSFLYLRRWHPRYQLIWLALAISIIVSTLLTGQHYVLDVLSGLAFGILGYWAGRLALRKVNPRFASKSDGRCQS